MNLVDTNTTSKNSNKNGFILLAGVIVVVCLIASYFLFFAKGDNDAAIEYKDPNGKVTASVDGKFMSLMVAIMNYQFGADALTDEKWETPVGDGGYTLKDYVVDYAVDYAEMLLKSEYLGDYVYGIGFSSEQKDDVDKVISEIVAVYGSEAGLENYLSGFGTNIASLRRFMELSMKQKTVIQAFYAKVTGEDMMSYFEDNYMIADHVMIKLRGAMKDDGTVMPLTEEERQAKLEYAKQIYNEIKGGVRDFDSAVAEFGEDTYKLAYPNGYFIPNDGNSNLDAKVISELRVMKSGEIRFVETESALYILRRNAMDRTLCLESADFATVLGSTIGQDEYWLALKALDGIAAYDDVISKLDPSAIASFNIDAIGQ